MVYGKGLYQNVVYVNYYNIILVYAQNASK